MPEGQPSAPINIDERSWTTYQRTLVVQKIKVATQQSASYKRYFEIKEPIV